MMEYNLIYMRATAELAVADSADPIFRYIFQSIRPYLTNGCTDCDLQVLDLYEKKTNYFAD